MRRSWVRRSRVHHAPRRRISRVYRRRISGSSCRCRGGGRRSGRSGSSCSSRGRRHDLLLTCWMDFDSKLVTHHRILDLQPFINGCTLARSHSRTHARLTRRSVSPVCCRPGPLMQHTYILTRPPDPTTQTQVTEDSSTAPAPHLPDGINLFRG